MLHATAPLLLNVFPLHLFPDGGLSRSIITTVLVGVVIMVVLNETFGWVLSGLVVPGYLAPIILIQPWSAAVIAFEAVMTHLLVVLVGRLLPRLGVWGEFFGRDRFFAYLLFGTVVRMLSEGFVLGAIGALANHAFGLEIDYRNSFYSVGVVVVPLMANMFFKPGIWRGSFCVATAVGLCYVAIRFALIPLTNFSINSFELSYGYYATDFFGNAKAYIILLTTAFLASRTNLVYGWDYSGILIPSLLALAWFTPLKVAATLGESVVILVLARWIASRRILQDVTIEAGRKLLLTFGVGFCFKYVSGFFLGWYEPGLNATSLYGFGYLLPALVAQKMWQKDSIALIARPLIQTSLTGAVAGSLLAKALIWALPAAAPPQIAPSAAPELRVLEAPLDVTIRLDRSRLVTRYDRKGMDRIYGEELARLQEAVGHVLEAQRTEPGRPATTRRLQRAAELLAPLHYEVARVRARSGEHYIVRETHREPGSLRGWGLFVFAARPRSDLVIEVPRPLEEPLALEVGAALLEELEARALLVAGADSRSSPDGRADVLRATRSPFEAVDEAHPHAAVLQVRVQTAPRASADAQIAGRPSRRPLVRGLEIFVATRLPAGLDLDRLTAVARRRPRIWLASDRRYERRNRQRDRSARPFATLVLDGPTAVEVLAQSARKLRRGAQTIATDVTRSLLRSLRSPDAEIAASGSNAYVAPDLHELAPFSSEIFGPLAQAALPARRRAASALPRFPPDLALRLASPVAWSLGYEIRVIEERPRGARFALLRERTDRPRRHRGTFLFRLGGGSPYVVEIPHPATERRTLASGVHLLRLLQARALLIAGASRYANRDGSADITDAHNQSSLFQLAHQTLIAADPSTLVVSVRGFESRGEPDLDVVASTGRPLRDISLVPARVRGLTALLSDAGLRVAYYDGSLAKLRFQGRRGPQWSYSELYGAGGFVHLWLGLGLRLDLERRLRGRSADVGIELGIPRRHASLEAVLARAALRSRRNAPRSAQRPAPAPSVAAGVSRVIDLLRRYAVTWNARYVRHAAAAAKDLGGGAQVTEITDRAARRAFVVFEAPVGARRVALAVPVPPALQPIAGAGPGPERPVACDAPDLTALVHEAVLTGNVSILLTKTLGLATGPPEGRR